MSRGTESQEVFVMETNNLMPGSLIAIEEYLEVKERQSGNRKSRCVASWICRIKGSSKER